LAVAALRTHVFRLGHRDGLGREWCAVCPLPFENQVHQIPDPLPDRSAAIQGEHDDD
jgi:hypothetical protein